MHKSLNYKIYYKYGIFVKDQKKKMHIKITNILI